MGDFFHGWRRKLGVVTLVMACFLAAGWVRSLRQYHAVQFPLGRQIALSIESTMGVIVSHQYVNPQVIAVETYSRRLEESTTFVWESNLHGKWHWRICGLGDYEYLQSNGKTQRVYVVPYPFIVIPLTLLSAYLLLVKPRPTKPTTKST